MAQSDKHKKKVKKIASKYKSEGYKTRADNVKGFKDPKKIRGHVPDVVARKNGQKKIREVETSSGTKSNKKQHSAFRKHANKRSNTTFKTKSTKKKSTKKKK